MGRMPGHRYANGASGRPSLSNPLLSAAPHIPVMQQIKVVNFDGFQFELQNFLAGMPLFEMTYRARRGDEAAIAVLTAAGVKSKDVHGRQYWPMVDAEPQPQAPAVSNKADASTTSSDAPGDVPPTTETVAE